MKFVENKFVAQLEVNKQLSEFIANQKRTWANDQDFIKELYEKIIASDIYKEYMASSDKSYEADRELWRKLYKTFVFNNDSLDHPPNPQVNNNTWILLSVEMEANCCFIISIFSVFSNTL